MEKYDIDGYNEKLAAEAAAEEAEAERAAAEADENFTIFRGVLKKYKGAGGNVTIPEGVTSIGCCAFSGCKTLKSVVMPDSVTSIRYSAFSGCKSLQSIVLSNELTHIEYKAFCGCKALSRISIPASVTNFGEMAFSECRIDIKITVKGGRKQAKRWFKYWYSIEREGKAVSPTIKDCIVFFRIAYK